VATIVLLGGQINDKLNSVVNVLKNNGSSTP
jgi:hypothetical protein